MGRATLLPLGVCWPVTGQGGDHRGLSNWVLERAVSSQLHCTKKETEAQREATVLPESTGGQLLNQKAPGPWVLALGVMETGCGPFIGAGAEPGKARLTTETCLTRPLRACCPRAELGPAARAQGRRRQGGRAQLLVKTEGTAAGLNPCLQPVWPVSHVLLWNLGWLIQHDKGICQACAHCPVL